MAFVLEGRREERLPENVMGTVRLSNITFNGQYREMNNNQEESDQIK